MPQTDLDPQVEFATKMFEAQVEEKNHNDAKMIKTCSKFSIFDEISTKIVLNFSSVEIQI